MSRPYDCGMPSRPRRSAAVTFEFWATIFACLCVVVALVIIWVARVSVGRDVYVSELGADGMPTAKWFEAALLLIVLGAAIIAFTARRLRSRLRVLRAWTPAISLWVASGCFLVASQVTCSYGCPVPYGPSFTWQDFIHTTLAVLAFAAACWGMAQIAFARGHRAIAIMSLTAAIVVAVVAGAGGLLSLFQFQVGFGSRLELVATTVAVAWLAVLGASLAGSLVRQEQPVLTTLAADDVEHLIR
jgi:hypothetical protein